MKYDGIDLFFVPCSVQKRKEIVKSAEDFLGGAMDVMFHSAKIVVEKQPVQPTNWKVYLKTRTAIETNAEGCCELLFLNRMLGEAIASDVGVSYLGSELYMVPDSTGVNGITDQLDEYLGV